MYHITGILMTRILFPQESETIAVKINLDTHVLSYLYSIKLASCSCMKRDTGSYTTSIVTRITDASLLATTPA